MAVFLYCDRIVVHGRERIHIELNVPTIPIYDAAAGIHSECSNGTFAEMPPKMFTASCGLCDGMSPSFPARVSRICGILGLRTG